MTVNPATEAALEVMAELGTVTVEGDSEGWRVDWRVGVDDVTEFGSSLVECIDKAFCALRPKFRNTTMARG